MKPPQLNNYGGDISRRWYVTYYSGGRWKKAYVSKHPAATFLERAEKLFLHYTEIYRAAARTHLQTYLLELLSTKRLRKRSTDSYRTEIVAFCKYINKQYLLQLTVADAQQYYSYLKNKGYADKTIANKLILLKGVFALTKNNIFAGISHSFTSDSEQHYPFSHYERTQIETYLAAHNPKLLLLTKFIFYGYIRPKELRYLQIQHINLRTRTIRIPGEIAKTNRSRNIAIMRPLLQAIQESGILNNPSNFYLFGKNLETCSTLAGANYATNLHRAALVKLGIYRENVTTLYSWKHTGNIEAYLHGLDIKSIQQLNGHRSLETTEIYLRKIGLYLDKQIHDFSY